MNENVVSGIIDLASVSGEAVSYVFIVVNWFKLRASKAHASWPPFVAFIASLVIVPLILLHRGFITQEMSGYDVAQVAAGVVLISLLVTGSSAGLQTITNKAAEQWHKENE